MADDGIDEDIFADLYAETDKPSKPAPAPVKAEEPSPVSSGPVNPVPAPATEAVAENTTSYQHAPSAESTDLNDSHMQGSSWNGNGNQGYDHPTVEPEDNYGPINVKEDG